MDRRRNPAESYLYKYNKLCNASSFPVGSLAKDQGSIFIAETLPLLVPLQTHGGPVKGVTLAHQGAAHIQNIADAARAHKVIRARVVQRAEVEKMVEEGLAHLTAPTHGHNALSLEEIHAGVPLRKLV